MDKNIEEVKKILNEYIDYETWLSEKSPSGEGDAAVRICQLFEPKPDEDRLVEELAELKNPLPDKILDTLTDREIKIVCKVSQIKNAECQAKVDTIIKDLNALWHDAEDIRTLERNLGDYIITLKKREGIEEAK